jgi:hypothetical protein
VRRVALLAVALGLLAVAALLWLRILAPPLPPAPTPERMAALRAERDALEASFRASVVARGEKSLAEAPRAGIMIGIPTSLTRSIVEQVVTGLFGETTLTLKNLKVHNEGKVRAKMLVRKRTLGEYVLDVQIHEIQGVLKPGAPRLAFGPAKVDLTLPVRLSEGKGNADLRFQWDSKGLAANMVCGDVDVTRKITGGVVPKDYEITGAFSLRGTGETIVLRPLFPDLAVRIFVDPSDQAWEVVDGVVKEQRKGCEIALNKIDIKEKLGGILGRGFNVKIPQKIFKPIKLPAGVRQSLEVHGLELALDVKPSGLLVASDRLWYGADLAVQSKRTASPARRPRSSPAPAPRSSPLQN